MGLDEAKNAIVKVGGGRGFVVQGERDRLVITAGHCLPDFPTCHSSSHTEERTYKALLGSLGEKPAVWAECLFADPIGDVAVLGPPDDQQPSDEFEGRIQVPKETPEPFPACSALAALSSRASKTSSGVA